MMNSTGYNHILSDYSNNELIKKESSDMDYQDMKSETSSNSSQQNQRGGKAKLFQCTGYGECNMVFTRSEHLARHMRKHTGEKPFKCVVPGCERMFSRFDNMMQHTQTHNKSKGQKRNKIVMPTTRTKRGGGRKPNSTRRTHDQEDSSYRPSTSLPSPPISRRNSTNNIHHLTANHKNQIILPQPIIQQQSAHFYHPQPPASVYQEKQNPFFGQPYYYHSYERLPDSPASEDDDDEEYQSMAPIRRRSAPHIRYHPYPAHKNKPIEHDEVLPTIIQRRQSILSQLATYLVDHPDKSPESYIDHQEQSNLPPRLPTRRLSIQDLSNPIEDLESQEKLNSKKEEEGVDLTEDEYQAIQGFGQFYRTAINL